MFARKTLTLILVIILISLCYLVLHFNQIRKDIVAWNTRRNIDQVNERYRNMIEYASIGDALLFDNVRDLTVSSQYPRCTRGEGFQVYGSSSDYQEVMNHYMDKFDNNDWSLVQSERTPENRLNFHNDPLSMSISLVPSTEFDQFDIEIQDEWSEYKSLYGVSFIFAEPIIVDCYL